MKLIKKSLLFAILINCFSCSSNLDFEQVQVLEASPAIHISLGFFNLTSPVFSDISSASGVPMISLVENVEYPIFENSILRDHLVAQEYTIEIANSFNRAFEVEISFLDRSGNNTFTPVLYTIEANNSNFKEKITVDDIETTNSTMKNTTTLRLQIRVKNQSIPLKPASEGSFVFKSFTSLYLSTSITL